MVKIAGMTCGKIVNTIDEEKSHMAPRDGNQSGKISLFPYLLHVRDTFYAQRFEDKNDRLDDVVVMLLQGRVTQDAHQNGDGDGREKVLHRAGTADQHLGW